MRVSTFRRRSGLSTPRSLRRARSRGRTARASPAIATFAGKFAPRTAGSMSTWIRSSGTLQPKLPVGISANRVPIASRQSQSANAFSAAGDAVRDGHGAPPHEEAGGTRLLEEVGRRLEETRVRRLGRRGRLEGREL